MGEEDWRIDPGMFEKATPAPIATPEEVGLAVEKLTAAAESRPGFAVVLAGAASIRTVLAALASSNAEIERVKARYQRAVEDLAELRVMLGRSHQEGQTLTDQVGRLREAAVRLVGAGLNEMAVKRLPLELSRHSALGAMLDVLGVPNDETEKPAAEWDRLLRAALSPTEPEAMEK